MGGPGGGGHGGEYCNNESLSYNQQVLLNPVPWSGVHC